LNIILFLQHWKQTDVNISLMSAELLPDPRELNQFEKDFKKLGLNSNMSCTRTCAVWGLCVWKISCRTGCSWISCRQFLFRSGTRHGSSGDTEVPPVNKHFIEKIT
jgi:hypothetical protein